MSVQQIAFEAPAQVRLTAADRLERVGAEAFDDEELLGLVLGGGAGARRTARRLIDRFGSLRDVVRAHPVELRIAGLGSAIVPRLAASAELGLRMARLPVSDPWLVRTPSDVAEPLIDAMGSLEREELRVLLLDTKNVVAAERTVYRGNLAGSSVRVGEVFRDAVRACAAAVIVAHNHPSGDPTPSAQDIEVTARLARVGETLGIPLLDHIVVGRRRCISLRAQGLLGGPP